MGDCILCEHRCAQKVRIVKNKIKRVDKASDAEHINSEQIERSAIIILLQQISRIL
jgi:hypothetical protein